MNMLSAIVNQTTADLSASDMVLGLRMAYAVKHQWVKKKKKKKQTSSLNPS